MIQINILKDNHRIGSLVLGVLGLTILSTFWIMSALDRVTQQIEQFFLFFALAFGIYVLAIGLVQHKLPHTKATLYVIVVCSILFRLVFLFEDPVLSDDLYRYAWDGKVCASGINPYSYPPQADELRHLRDEDIYPHVNHKELPTIYPPVLQYAFGLAVSVSPSILSIKILIFACELVTLFILGLLLRRVGRSPNLLIIYGWNPLVVIEYAWSGHNDIIAILFLLVAIYFTIGLRERTAVAVITCSFLAKLAGIMLLPFMTQRQKYALGLARNVAFSVFLAVLFFLPYLDRAPQLLTSLYAYSVHWEFNGSIYPLLLSAVEQLDLTWQVVGGPHKLITKAILGIGFALLFIYLLRTHLKSKPNPYSLFWYALILLGAGIVINPTVHPWYVTWIVPVLCFVMNRAWLVLSGSVILSYFVLVEYDAVGIWNENIYIRLIEYIPFYAMLAFDLVRARRSGFGLGTALSNN